MTIVVPSCGLSTTLVDPLSSGDRIMSDPTASDPNRVWPTGLTEPESQELHRHLIQGTQIFGVIAAFAHLLAYIYSPWLK
jgi:light-harvesting protein B-800-850 beta chain